MIDVARFYCPECGYETDEESAAKGHEVNRGCYIVDRDEPGGV